MSRPLLPRELAGVAVMIVAGLGLGFGVGGAWRADPSLAGREPASAGCVVVVVRPGGTAALRAKDPQPAEHAPTRCALLDRRDEVRPLAAGPAARRSGQRRARHAAVAGAALPVPGRRHRDPDRSRRPSRPAADAAEHRARVSQLAEQAREGDQVVVLLAGHGSQQPESDPPDAAYPEPDGLDEIFLPADVNPWQGAANDCPARSSTTRSGPGCARSPRRGPTSGPSSTAATPAR